MQIGHAFALLLSTLAWGGVVGVHQALAQQPEKSAKIRVGVASAPKTLDAALAADAAGARLLQLTHPALLQWGEGYRPVGLVAQQCVASSRQQVVCTLPAGKSFLSGAPLNASAVAAWLAQLQGNPRSPLKGMLEGVTFHAESPTRLVFELEKVSARVFLTRLVQIPLADPAAPEYGMGPYRAMAESATGVVVLQPARAGLPVLRFVPIADAATRVLQLRQREVDVLLHDLAPGLVSYAVQQAPQFGWQVVSVPGTSYSYLVVNHRHPWLGNAAVREALSLSLNRAQLRRVLLNDLAAPANSLLPPGHVAVWPAPEDPFDPLSAETLLDSLTNAAGETLFPGPDGTRLELTLLTSTDAASQRLAQALQAQWAEVGVRIHLRSAEWASFHTHVQKGQFDLALLTWTGEQEPAFYHRVFHSAQTPPNGLNRGHVNDATLDALLEQLLQAETEAEDMRFAKAVQQRVAVLRPYIPLWRRHHVLVMGRGVEGCTVPPSGAYTGLAACRKTME